MNKKTCILVQSTPNKHPGPPRRLPGGTQEAPRRPETTWRQNICFHVFFFSKRDASEYFRVDGSDPTITVYRACAQDFAVGGAQIGDQTIPNTEDTPPEPLQQMLTGKKRKTGWNLAVQPGEHSEAGHLTRDLSTLLGRASLRNYTDV